MMAEGRSQNIQRFRGGGGGGGGKGVIDHVSHIVRWGDWVKLSKPPPPTPHLQVNLV